MESLVMPRYGAGALADVIPSLLAGLQVPDMVNVLDLPSARKVCVLLVDGLGWRLLQTYRDDAPFLSSLVAGREPITAGFPSTTVTSIAALGTGLPPGEHGLVGYSFAISDTELLNALTWSRHGLRHAKDLRSQAFPEQIQPRRTAWERATDAGVAVRFVTPHAQESTGLTRAVLRGGAFRKVHALGDLAGRALEALGEDGRSLCYAYHADLDTLGHVYGPGSDPWRYQLAHIDRLAATIAGRLPRAGMLIVTADHGMVTVAEEDRIDFDAHPRLHDGVRMLGGEARVRYLYTESGATEDVLDRWHEMLGEQAWIVRRDEAIEAGWFGPRVADHVRDRIGDLIIAARGNIAVIRSALEPRQSQLVGHHGSLTADEQLIPLLVFHNSQ
ncbi:MAG TPA: alkaline phosphatase family protein [Pseudonocardiaceae bacterium]